MHKQLAQTENWRLNLLPMAAEAASETVLGGTVSIDREGGIALHTGVMYGPVDATFEVLDHGPEDSGREWEDIVELSARATEAAPLMLLGIFSDGDESSEPEIGAKALVLGRNYRVRIHARGRDESDIDELIEPGQPAKDHVLFQVWPSDVKEPEVLRMSSERAHEDDRNSQPYSGFGYVALGMSNPDREDLIAQNLKKAGE